MSHPIALTDEIQKSFANSIICGDALNSLRKLPDEIITTIVTSPPYYRQRDYRNSLQIGNEPDPNSYLKQLVAVFGECRRVLNDTGTLWVNLGDKYINGQLMGMPWRLAFALQDDGWLLRSDIIWYKPNAMPSSVKSRPTTDHEYMFLFSKGPKYSYNADAIRQPHVTFTAKSRMMGGRKHLGIRGGTPENGKNKGNSNLHKARWDQAFHPLGRNRRTVWEIPLSKFPDAHFAVFPEKLVQLCVLATTQEGDVVLDPFLGSGTTALVSARLNRQYVGIDCNPEYCRMANRRLQEIGLLDF